MVVEAMTIGVTDVVPVEAMVDTRVTVAVVGDGDGAGVAAGCEPCDVGCEAG